MSSEQYLKNVTIPAGADLSARQYCFMSVNASGQLVASAAGAEADGILQNKPSAAGDAATLAINGISKLVAGSGGVTAGDPITSGANGTGVTTATGDAQNGVALETAAAGAIFKCLLKVS